MVERDGEWVFEEDEIDMMLRQSSRIAFGDRSTRVIRYDCCQEIENAALVAHPRMNI